MTQRFDIIVWDKIPQKGTDEKRTIARKVGNAKRLDNGSVQCFVAKGIAVSGQFTIAPWIGSEASEADDE